MRKLALSLTLAGLAMTTACGDDAPTEPVTPESKNIVQTAQTAGTFSTLVTAINAAELAATLSGPGPFTVFAPTDAAFAALPAGALDGLLADKPKLADVLKYHVVAGKLDAAAVSGLTEVTTLQGGKLAVSVSNGEVRIGGAKVTTPNVQASNGIIHVIDAVLLPPAAPSKNIVELAVATPALSTLVTAVTAAELAETLSGPGPFTVFAPTNDAFAALPAGALEGLLADKPQLIDVLKLHVVAGRLDAAAVSGVTELTTLQGAKIPVSVMNGEVRVGGAKVSTPNVEASNGIVHIIDAVILPAPAPLKNIVELAVATPELSTLVTAVQAAELATTLSGPGPFTVFAPTNAAFAAIPPAALNALLADKPELTKVLTYHVVAGTRSSEQVAAATSLTSLLGPALPVTVTGTTVRIAGARIRIVDIQASNGVVHVIDAVMLPPSIVDLAVATPTLSTLVAAVTAAELVETLEGPGPFTVFAPVNDAFAALPPAELARLLRPENKAELTAILQLHVVSGQFLAADVVGRASLTTVSGSTLAVAMNNGMVTVGGAPVVATDIRAKNGVVHVISSVILPNR
jgi:transforming growth factor-beta-induced protein